MRSRVNANRKSPYTLLACGERYILIGTEEGLIGVQPSIVESSFRLGFNVPAPAFGSEHYFTRAARVEGEMVTVKDSVILQQYRCRYDGETFDVWCAFDEIEKTWFVRR